MRRFIWIGGCALLLALPACSPDERQEVGATEDRPSAAESRLRVLTVNYPLAYFAARIGGDEADVRYPGPEDEDPAYWSPTAE